MKCSALTWKQETIPSRILGIIILTHIFWNINEVMPILLSVSRVWITQPFWSQTSWWELVRSNNFHYWWRAQELSPTTEGHTWLQWGTGRCAWGKPDPSACVCMDFSDTVKFNARKLHQISFNERWKETKLLLHIKDWKTMKVQHRLPLLTLIYKHSVMRCLCLFV